MRYNADSVWNDQYSIWIYLFFWAFERAVRYSLIISSGFCKLFQELPAGRFEKATKTRFQFHKAAATIPNAAGAKPEKFW